MVDNAQMRYFIVHLHRLLDPRTTQARATGGNVWRDWRSPARSPGIAFVITRSPGQTYGTVPLPERPGNRQRPERKSLGSITCSIQTGSGSRVPHSVVTTATRHPPRS